MEEIKGDKGFTAKETYRKLHTKHSNKNDQLRMPTDRPKSTKQCENVKYNQKKAKKIAHDEIFNTIEFAVQSDNFLENLSFTQI